ncbi:hypothetical protein ABFX02_14G284900 [Erythranthe guttata]
MAKLSDDLILRIISRLPLKSAVRCKLLSKNYNVIISTAKFGRLHALRSSNPTVFHCPAVNSRSFTRIDPLSGSDPISTALPIGISILASCNGVLLARIDCYNEYHVLNPITGGATVIDHRIGRSQDIALAVDLVNPISLSSKFQFKLVTFDVNPNPTRYWSTLRFAVVVHSGAPIPAGYPATVVKPEVVFKCKNFARMADRSIRPVYAHGCVHWLGDDAESIVSFNVVKEKPRITDGPLKNGSLNKDAAAGGGGGKWFGVAQGSLQFVHGSPEVIVVYKHDYANDRWRVSHKIGNIYNPRAVINNHGTPVLFDGQRLFVRLGKRIYVHCSGKWEKKGKVGCGDEVFFEFIPTLASVSNEHWKRFQWANVSFYAMQSVLRCSN